MALFAFLILQWTLQPLESLPLHSFHLPLHSFHHRGHLRHTTNGVGCSNRKEYIEVRRPWGTLTRRDTKPSDNSLIILNSQSNDINIDVMQQNSNDEQDRRSFLERSALSILSSGALSAYPSPANARGLVRFPCTEPLSNAYHFLRAGSNLLETEDIWSTNPLFLTNREAALSEIGEEQVRRACKKLSATVSQPTIIRYSLAAASIDTANIVGEELNIGRDRLVPEFNYADCRAIGAWDFAAKNATEQAVWAMDVDEAGPYGKGGKPPPNEDGTPAETLADQVVRLTNLMSVLETLYSGDTVLVVFPDGTGPALLSCLIGGISLNRCHELEYAPGEVRTDIDYKSVNALASQPPSQTYLDTIEHGRVELKQLRANPDALRNVKDLKYEEEREKERLELEVKKKEKAKAEELERQRKKEEGLQMQENSADGSTLGIAGAVVAAGAVAIGVLGGSDDDESEKGINEGQNVTEVGTDSESALNSTTPAIKAGFDGIMYFDEDSTDDELLPLENDMISDGATPEEILNNAFEEPPAVQIQEDDIDYDDAWLTSISSIINDSDSEDD